MGSEKVELLAKCVSGELIKHCSKEKAEFFPRFFKTGPGQYGEGDKFIGVTVPLQRLTAKKFKDLPLKELKILLHSPIHEERLTSLLILVDQFEKGDKYEKKTIFDFYIKNKNHINNWDLVDSSAEKIAGAWLLDKDIKLLEKLAISKNLWDRRIAIIATYAFIKKGEFKPTLKISKILLKDDHDLIHKAVGWMLREIGKRNIEIEKSFLDEYAKVMPRTMLRYAIEKFDDTEKKKYLDTKTPF